MRMELGMAFGDRPAAARYLAVDTEVPDLATGLGSVNVNNVMTNVFQLPVPFGGRRSSGLGVRHGRVGWPTRRCRTRTASWRPGTCAR